ncbi:MULTISPECIES: hypothetical protein [Acinetobacter]|uniref:hypothetical protein n=1 Tax=Acinetobacter TaxID=469 RepID=UPI000EA36CB0|nr:MULTISPECIES: hypothetical protein [Acinetobacter]RKG45133.1 hypothetical protein D7V51_05725 [Acinetobacter cumulans]RZG60128.1 hypothetical protein EXE29_06400 [Acinetobacter sp. WCHAc060006]
MTDLSPAEIELLEEFREELTSHAVSNIGFTTELSAELVQAIYKLVCEKINENDLPYKIVKSLMEVS